jgi:membrane fusion protein (multidrug efflux system)
VVAQTEGAKEVEIRARVGGILEARLYHEGDAVKAGQALFRIDRTPYELALAKARAEEQMQRANLAQAEVNFARMAQLLPHHTIPQQTYDAALATLASTRASHQAAIAAREQAELNLSWTTVTAPVAGIVGRVLRSEGTLVDLAAQGLLTTLIQIDPLWVRFSLSEAEVARLPSGRLAQLPAAEVARLPGGHLAAAAIQGVELILPDGSTHPARGRINFAARRYDPRLGSLELRAEFDNPNGALLPGQFARVRLLLGEREGVFLIPQTAVVQTEAGRSVFVLGPDGTAVSRPLKTAEWRGKDWVVLEGLQDGERVVLDNLLKVRPGTPLAEAPATPTAPAATTTSSPAATVATAAPATPVANTPAPPTPTASSAPTAGKP